MEAEPGISRSWAHHYRRRRVPHDLGERNAMIGRFPIKILATGKMLQDIEPIPPRERASGQAAARLVERRVGDFFGGGRSKSAGTRKRARRRCTIAMLSPFLPRNTSLTRLGEPSRGTRSARVSPC